MGWMSVCLFIKVKKTELDFHGPWKSSSVFFTLMNRQTDIQWTME